MSKKNQKKFKKWQKNMKEVVHELDLNVSKDAFNNLDGYWLLFHVLKELGQKRQEILDSCEDNEE